MNIDIERRIRALEEEIERLRKVDSPGVSGTWTPTFTGSGGAGTITYDTQSGFYFRIGNLVICRFHVNTNTVSAAPTGNLLIGGLPFTSAASATATGPSVVTDFSNLNLTAGYTQLGLRVQASATTALFAQSGDNVGAIALAGSAMTGNDVECVGTLIYEVA